MGESGGVLGGVALVLIGLRGLVSGLAAPHSGIQPRQTHYDLRSILLIGASVSTESLVAGFGLGLYGVPIVAAVLITAGVNGHPISSGIPLRRRGGCTLGGYTHRFASAALAVIGAALRSHLI